MPRKASMVALVAAGCMLAAGLGAYLAVRRNAADFASSSLASSPPTVASPGSPRGGPGAVADTDATLGTAGLAPQARPAAAARPGRFPSAPAGGKSGPATARASSDRTDRVTRGAPPSRPGAARDEGPVPRPAETDVVPSPGLPVVGEPVAAETFEPLQPQYEELVVAADSVIGLQIEHALSSEHARLEDPVEARVTRDVLVGGKVAIPAGTRVLGSVTLVERGGKVKTRARLGIRFHTLVLADATRVPIETESIFREGEPPANESAAKIGGAAVGGAILGAILGGTKGAVIGGAAGAAGGTAAVMAGDRNAATLPAGATVTVRLTAPVTVTVQK